jgi:hypothetical protein
VKIMIESLFLAGTICRGSTPCTERIIQRNERATCSGDKMPE